MVEVIEGDLVVGMLEAFDFKNNPNLVTGLAARTEAGVELVQKLSGIKALNVMERDALPQLKTILEDALDL